MSTSPATVPDVVVVLTRCGVRSESTEDGIRIQVSDTATLYVEKMGTHWMAKVVPPLSTFTPLDPVPVVGDAEQVSVYVLRSLLNAGRGNQPEHRYVNPQSSFKS